MTPRSQGSIDYPSTRGIQVDVGLPDTTSENRAEKLVDDILERETGGANCRNLNITEARSATLSLGILFPKIQQFFRDFNN